jgi:hypothetical protein
MSDCGVLTPDIAVLPALPVQVPARVQPLGQKLGYYPGSYLWFCGSPKESSELQGRIIPIVKPRDKNYFATQYRRWRQS